MKIELGQVQNYSNTTFEAKFSKLKPSFKAEIPDEFVNGAIENVGENSSVLGWLAGTIAAVGAGFAFFRNRKARIAKELTQREKELAEKTKTESQELLSKLKAENEALNKQLDEIHNMLIAPTKDVTSNPINSKKNTRSSSHNNSSNGYSSHTNTRTKNSSGEHSNWENMTTEEIIQEQKEWQENFNRKCDELESEITKHKEVFEFSAVKKKLEQLANKKGFDRILGYQAQKDFLINKFINPLKNKEELPNVILMYGPKGTGKTLFAKATAYEGNVNYIDLELGLTKEENLQLLKDAINQSKVNFEKTGQHSILHLDEIDGVVCNEEYSNIINKLSEDHHATLIATTNYFKNVDPKIINANKTDKLYMPTATEDDIAKILEYVLKDFSEPDVNFHTLAEAIIKNANDNAYSNAKIYLIADTVVNNHYAEMMNKKLKQNISSDLKLISEDEILKYIEKNLKPDISKKELDESKNIFCN